MFDAVGSLVSDGMTWLLQVSVSSMSMSLPQSVPAHLGPIAIHRPAGRAAAGNCLLNHLSLHRSHSVPSDLARAAAANKPNVQCWQRNVAFPFLKLSSWLDLARVYWSSSLGAWRSLGAPLVQPWRSSRGSTLTVASGWLTCVCA